MLFFSVVVREDKKLLTVLFPDGRDGRAFTLKAETSEDLFEWKTALEQALAQAPSAALVMGHNGIFRNDTTDSIEGSFHQCSYSLLIESCSLVLSYKLIIFHVNNNIAFIIKNIFIGFCRFFVILDFYLDSKQPVEVIFSIFLLVLPGRDKRPVKSLVVGRPILLALEDIDGGPSFLEKALRFLEKYGKL